jgi:hypothetical protein
MDSDFRRARQSHHDYACGTVRPAWARIASSMASWAEFADQAPDLAAMGADVCAEESPTW